MFRSFFLFIFLVIIFAVLNVFDGISTYLVVSNSSLRSEKNPFARFVFKKLGLMKGILSLKAISILLVPVIYFYERSLRFELNIILSIANLFYIYVIINNYRNYFKIRKKNVAQTFLFEKKENNV